MVAGIRTCKSVTTACTSVCPKPGSTSGLATKKANRQAAHPPCNRDSLSNLEQPVEQRAGTVRLPRWIDLPYVPGTEGAHGRDTLSHLQACSHIWSSNREYLGRRKGSGTVRLLLNLVAPPPRSN